MAISAARQARRDARATLDSATSSNAQKRRARAVIQATKPVLQAESDIRGMSLEDLREGREAQMDIRAERFKTGGDQTIEATIAAANMARAYADAMRGITGRERGEQTPYTGGGVELTGTPGVDQRVLRQPFQAFRDLRFMGDPTDAQLSNIDWMLREGEGDTVQDIRRDWREEVWDDTWNPATGRWERGDRTAALATQGGLLDQPAPNIFNPDDPYNIKLSASGNNITPKVGGVGGGGHYYARPYSIPRMQTGEGWEGLGAEYQPGTVEGLGLLAGKAYAPYEPLRTGLLNARPSFMGTPKGFTPMNFEGGLDLGDDTTTTNNTTNTGTDFMWHYTPGYGQHNTDWTWGSKSNVYTDPHNTDWT